MPPSPPAALLLAALLAVSAARADELTEDGDAIRGARMSTLGEVRNMVQRGMAGAAVTVPPGQEAQVQESLVQKLRHAYSELTPGMDKLIAMRSGYAGLEDFAEVEAKRAGLRGPLEEGHRAFNESLQQVEAVLRQRIEVEVHGIARRAGSQPPIADFLKVLEIRKSVRDVRDFEWRLREALRLDQEAYDSALKELDDRRAKASLRRGLLLWGAGVLGGIVLLGWWAWLRARAAGASAPGPGAVIGGNYRLERELGRGGMGVVFEGTDLGLNRKVAIKQLKAELKASRRDLEQFLEEARLVAALKHPGIVEIYSIADEPSGIHLVFELVQGRTLDALLQQAGRLNLGDALALLKQAGAALDYAHGRQVIHRDLKPGNIMVTPGGTLKVMDFGLAHRVSMTLSRLSRVASSGTPPYMAPEQELGHTSPESDLFSLAVMTYELLTGKLPFPGPNYLAQKRELVVVPPSEAAPGLPGALDAVFRRAFCPEPRDRFHSAAQFLEALAPQGAQALP